MAGLLDTEARPRGITTAMSGMYVQIPIHMYEAMEARIADLEDVNQSLRAENSRLDSDLELAVAEISKRGSA